MRQRRKRFSALEQAVCIYLQAHPDCEGDVRTFDSPSKLLEAVQSRDGRFDVFVLDIVMSGQNDIDLGAAIHVHDPGACITYTTSSKEYVLQAFGMHALSYLLKPIDPGQLSGSLDEARERCLLHPARHFEINGKEGLTTVDLDVIITVENRFRSAHYAFADGTEVASTCNRGTFEENVGKLASDPAFMHPHKSYFVNMRMIRAVRAAKLMLDDGREIPISHCNVADVRRRYADFLSREGVGC